MEELQAGEYMAYYLIKDGQRKAFVVYAETRVIDDEGYTDVRLFGSEGNVMYYPATYGPGDDITISSNYSYGLLSSDDLFDLADLAALNVGYDFGQFIYDPNVPSIDDMFGYFEI